MCKAAIDMHGFIFFLLFSSLVGCTATVRPKPDELLVLKERCEQGNSNSCAELGYRYRNGTPELQPEYKTALWAFERACAGNDGYGCRGLASLYTRGLGVEADAAKAHELYLRACSLNNLQGCFNAAVTYRDGIGTKKDTSAALELFRRGCDESYADSCFNLAFFYRMGVEVEASPAEEFKLFERSCELGSAMGCTNAGDMLEAGRAGDRDSQKARCYFRIACDKNEMYGCRLLALSLLAKKDDKDAAAAAIGFLEKACKLGHKHACLERAELNESN